MNKSEIAEIFEEIGALLDLKGENPFRVRAYLNAARMIEGLPEDLGKLVAENRLTEIKGIGKDLAAKITEMVTTNHLKFYDELKASMPQGLLEMLKIPGFGPKRAKIVYEKLKVDSIEKLEAACKAGKIAALDGFGEKSQQKILEGIVLARQFSSRHHYHKARAVADPILDALRAHDGVIRCSIAGSLRRCRETIGDIDFLVSAKPKDAPGIIEDFARMPGMLSVSAKGETKASVVLKGGIQADLRVVTDAQYAFALNYFTGSKEHNIALRARALKLKNLSLNEYGFSPAGEKEKSAKELGSSIKCKTRKTCTRRSNSTMSRPNCARTWARSKPPRKGSCRSSSNWRTCAAHSTVTRPGATALRALKRWRKRRWTWGWSISASPTTASPNGKPTASTRNASASKPKKSRNSTRSSPRKVSASSSAPNATSLPTARSISTTRRWRCSITSSPASTKVSPWTPTR